MASHNRLMFLSIEDIVKKNWKWTFDKNLTRDASGRVILKTGNNCLFFAESKTRKVSCEIRHYEYGPGYHKISPLETYEASDIDTFRFFLLEALKREVTFFVMNNHMHPVEECFWVELTHPVISYFLNH